MYRHRDVWSVPDLNNRESEDAPIEIAPRPPPPARAQQGERLSESEFSTRSPQIGFHRKPFKSISMNCLTENNALPLGNGRAAWARQHAVGKILLSVSSNGGKLT
jgi:hypothetical protein